MAYASSPASGPSVSMPIRPNRLKDNIRAGRRSLGTWIETGSPIFAEMAALSGLDFFITDQEHGSGELQTAFDMMRAAACASTTAVIRTPQADLAYIRRLVEAGAQALLVPMVETAQQARDIVRACRFPPFGARGDAACVTRSGGYGFFQDYYAQAADNLLIMVQIETETAVKNAHEIAMVDGVDLIFIGPSDLAGSLNKLGQTGDPEVEKLIASTMAAARQAGKPLGTVPRQGRTWQQLFDEGFLVVPTGCDISCYYDMLVSLVHSREAYGGQTA